MATVGFQDLTPLQILLRMSACTLAGSAIGLERLISHKVVGLKTNTLVAMGAGVFGLIGTNSLYLPGWAASQFMVGVITGIGFLGSTIVLREGGHVQGANSAATIWVAAGVGLSCGMGQYGVATVSLVFVLIIQYLHRWIEDKLVPRHRARVEAVNELKTESTRP